MCSVRRVRWRCSVRHEAGSDATSRLIALKRTGSGPHGGFADATCYDVDEGLGQRRMFKDHVGERPAPDVFFYRGRGSSFVAQCVTLNSWDPKGQSVLETMVHSSTSTDAQCFDDKSEEKMTPATPRASIQGATNKQT